MMLLTDIEWDVGKNEINKLLHHVAFEDAQYIFADTNRLERIDESDENYSGEERWQTIGRVGSILYVVYTERGNKKRIISARMANKNERRFYEGYYFIDDDGWSTAT
jgi:uncharacterized DUF497 family protein